MFDDMSRNFPQDDQMWNSFWRRRIQEDGREIWSGEERDVAYLQEMYPRESKVIRRFVEEALELEDYRGSFIYDEYPDKFLFLRMANKIADRYTNDCMARANGENMCEPGKKMWITEVVQVILANEIYRKRSRRRYW